MLTVYNVKQGDSMLLAGMSSGTCCFDNEPLLIDCGLQKALVHSMIGAKPKRIRAVVTHADRDHIGGLHDVLANHLVSRLYVPRYLPEILRIEYYLRKKSMRRAAHLPAVGAGRRIEVAEGDYLCSHTQVMNPPKLASNALRELGVNNISITTLQDAVLALRSHGLQLEAGDIIDYTPEKIDVNEEQDEAMLDRRTSTPKFRERRRFFQGFFIHLAQHLQGSADSLQVDAPALKDFNPTGKPDTDQAISNAFQLAANQVSIVFRYVGTTRFLFTGDADKAVFRRMIAKGHPLEAEYLKVPHHGSRHNLDASSLAAIAPKYAVVSHGNGKFARDPDSHPHMDTINLLSSHGVTAYYTNSVHKGGKIIVPATKGKTPCKYLHFK